MVAPHLDARAETADIEEREVNDVAGLKVLPGVKDLLAVLPPERYAIVTSGSRRLATARLRAAGLPFPEPMISADDIVHGKPNPEPYLKGARLLGYQPHDCLVFEDTPPGIRAARSAEMTVIAMPNTYSVDELSEADLVISSMQSLHVEMARSGGIRLAVEADLKLSSAT
jgi:sugar-phosphatase